MRTNDINNYMRPSRVRDGMPDIKEEGFRRPTILEAAQYFQMANEATIRGWWIKREKIFGNRSVDLTRDSRSWATCTYGMRSSYRAACTVMKSRLMDD
jgi:hypothetical protein